MTPPSLSASDNIFTRVDNSNDNGSSSSGGNSGNNNSGLTTIPMLPMTPETIQRVAAALNIPWSESLEQAVLTQSLLASIPLALQQPATPQLTPLIPQFTGTMPFSITPATSTSSSTATGAAATTPTHATTLANVFLNHSASINVAHDISAMDISPPCTPRMSMSSFPMAMSSPTSPVSPSLLPLDMSRTSSASSLTRSPPPPPPLHLSILSSTQTRLPVTTSNGSPTTVQTTMYKSTYRSLSLSKRHHRDRDSEEPAAPSPPSVLDGKDLSEMDEVALKRAKNTDAARRSRYKKMVQMESLEQRVAELEVENSLFESKLNEVELERSLLADKDRLQQARIRELENLLASLRGKSY
ncbi:hypothetical protein BGZ99_002127 [Dissophora globulifera]|uniref:BZIP domain-containing protein n=1 Tax=Dissophora globulifera TaxID=979702 RepID=A0A9P6V0A2_9FUNG|nr:hypothetical protein BGZ99_002127 [Dissophora globulifera]